MEMLPSSFCLILYIHLVLTTFAFRGKSFRFTSSNTPMSCSALNSFSIDAFHVSHSGSSCASLSVRGVVFPQTISFIVIRAKFRIAFFVFLSFQPITQPWCAAFINFEFQSPSVILSPFRILALKSYNLSMGPILLFTGVVCSIRPAKFSSMSSSSPISSFDISMDSVTFGLTSLHNPRITSYFKSPFNIVLFSTAESTSSNVV